MANAKGSVLVGPVKYLRKRRDAALALLAPEHAHYLDTEIRLSSWYPEQDLVALVRAVAQLMSYRPEEAIEAMGAAGAHEHAGVYGDLLRTLESTSSVFALWSSQHDSGELRGIFDTPTTARVRLIGFDSPSDVNCLLCRGYIRGVLAANGFEDISIEKPRCVLQDDPHCEWRLSWRNPDATGVTPVPRRAR